MLYRHVGLLEGEDSRGIPDNRDVSTVRSYRHTRSESIPLSKNDRSCIRTSILEEHQLLSLITRQCRECSIGGIKNTHSHGAQGLRCEGWARSSSWFSSSRDNRTQVGIRCCNCIICIINQH